MKKYLTEWKKFLKEEYENIDYVQNFKAFWVPNPAYGYFSEIETGMEIEPYRGNLEIEKEIEKRRQIICPNAPARLGGKFCCPDPEGFCVLKSNFMDPYKKKYVEQKNTVFEVSVSGKVGIYNIPYYERLYDILQDFKTFLNMNERQKKTFDDMIYNYFSGREIEDGYDKSFYEMVVNPGRIVIKDVYQIGDEWDEQDN